MAAFGSTPSDFQLFPSSLTSMSTSNNGSGNMLRPPQQSASNDGSGNMMMRPLQHSRLPDRLPTPSMSPYMPSSSPSSGLGSYYTGYSASQTAAPGMTTAAPPRMQYQIPPNYDVYKAQTGLPLANSRAPQAQNALISDHQPVDNTISKDETAGRAAKEASLLASLGRNGATQIAAQPLTRGLTPPLAPGYGSMSTGDALDNFDFDSFLNNSEPAPITGSLGRTSAVNAAANGTTAAVAGSSTAQGAGNHALQDYQMQLMLLEQQNKKRLLMARQEEDSAGNLAPTPSWPSMLPSQTTLATGRGAPSTVYSFVPEPGSGSKPSAHGAPVPATQLTLAQQQQYGNMMQQSQQLQQLQQQQQMMLAQKQRQAQMTAAQAQQKQQQAVQQAQRQMQSLNQQRLMQNPPPKTASAGKRSNPRLSQNTSSRQAMSASVCSPVQAAAPSAPAYPLPATKKASRSTTASTAKSKGKEKQDSPSPRVEGRRQNKSFLPRPSIANAKSSPPPSASTAETAVHSSESVDVSWNGLKGFSALPKTDLDGANTLSVEQLHNLFVEATEAQTEDLEKYHQAKQDVGTKEATKGGKSMSENPALELDEAQSSSTAVEDAETLVASTATDIGYAQGKTKRKSQRHVPSGIPAGPGPWKGPLPFRGKGPFTLGNTDKPIREYCEQLGKLLTQNAQRMEESLSEASRTKRTATSRGTNPARSRNIPSTQQTKLTPPSPESSQGCELTPATTTAQSGDDEHGEGEECRDGAEQDVERIDDMEEDLEDEDVEEDCHDPTTEGAGDALLSHDLVAGGGAELEYSHAHEDATPVTAFQDVNEDVQSPALREGNSTLEGGLFAGQSTFPLGSQALWNPMDPGMIAYGLPGSMDPYLAGQGNHQGMQMPQWPSYPQISNSQDSMRLMEQSDQIQRLEAELNTLRMYTQALNAQAAQNAEAAEAAQAAQEEPAVAEGAWPTLHRVRCPGQPLSTYLDPPAWIVVDNVWQLHSQRRIASEEDWERRHADVPFVVYLNYNCVHHEDDPDSEEPPLHSRPPMPFEEDVRILSEDLREALIVQFEAHRPLNLYFPFGFYENWTLSAPYVMHYQCRSQLEDSTFASEQGCEESFELFLRYIREQSSYAEKKADEFFRKGLVCPKYMKYLFGPGEMLVREEDNGTIALKQMVLISQTKEKAWQCRAERVTFDGNTFWTSEASFDIQYPDTTEDFVRIDELNIYPLQHADVHRHKDHEHSSLRSELLERGKFFYSCRKGRYVTGPEQNSSEAAEARYMVDVATHRIMHPDKVYLESFGLSGSNKQEAEDTTSDDFLVRLPSTIKGYHMVEKKWYTLDVDDLVSVIWNDQAFEALVVSDDTKELIQAVVTNKIEVDRSTDLVSGKGVGLIVLLHGGPGTGKTLTAESVAEIAKKPLYRVTCGDIGTEPRKVEEYLEQVFTLGRRWGCVVLLDEADVFLEQRSIANLERNALVSVFLRVLEYYDGILLLTSNRVGTFDEAFKSRIQLAIHYDTLSEQQRKQIWDNFIHRLEGLEENMDTVDVRAHIAELATHELNGRQIRNVITTSRQLAKFKKQAMDSTHLKRAIGVSTKFEKYLLEVRDQATDEEVARETGVR